MGRLRGQRNRDQDRYWTIQRRAEQSGMVGALDVPVCCFCSCLIATIDAHFNDYGDAFCERCGHERGLIEVRRINSKTALSVLESVDALSYSEGVTGKSGRSQGRIDVSLVGIAPGRSMESYRRTQTLERFRSEIESEAQRADLRCETIGASWRRFLKDARQRMRLWLARDTEFAQASPTQIAREAFTLTRGSDRTSIRLAVHAQRQKVYFQEHPLRKAQVPRKLTDAQALAIRLRYKRGNESQYALARAFGVSQCHVASILQGSVYRSAGGPLYWPERGWLDDDFAREYLERKRPADRVA